MNESTPTVKVLLADDTAFVRRTIMGLLEGTSNIQVLSETDSIEETISLASALRPDVIILDLKLSYSNGVSPDFLRNQFFLCGSRVLAMTICDVEAEEIKQLAESIGAAVLLDKANLLHELIPAILSQKKTVAGQQTPD